MILLQNERGAIGLEDEFAAYALRLARKPRLDRSAIADERPAQQEDATEVRGATRTAALFGEDA
jgi:hypothetical protein